MKDVFFELSEGDVVHVDYGAQEYETDVKLVSGSGEDKRVSLSLTQKQPTIVIRSGQLMVETRPLGHPREWSMYTKINKLDIVKEN